MNIRAQLLKAISLATLAHAGQRRKGSDTPYVIHPIRVALTLHDAPLPDGVCRDDCLVAAILHDILEDTQVPREQLVEQFGEPVVAIVDELTEDKTLPKPQRRKKMLKHCATMSRSAQVVKLADRLDNMRDMGCMPGDFIARICDEARVMLEAMRGTCPPLESEIAAILAYHDDDL